MKAIVLQGQPGRCALVTDRPYPKARPGYVLVDVKAVALNPTDWKHIDRINHKGALCGCDYAGVVAETGSGYVKDWKVGDRIAGFVHGANHLNKEDGAFAERIAAKADIAYRIPRNMSFEEAATLGVGVLTVGQGLFQQMGLGLPVAVTAMNETVLIYGGSTATGLLGIQFAKLAGYKVIATCSPHNFDLVKSFGAAEAFDYNDSNFGHNVRQYIDNKLKYVWDTISLPSSAKLCAEVISPGRVYGTVLKVDFPREDVKLTYSLGYTAPGEAVDKGHFKTDGNPEDFAFSKKWSSLVDPLLSQGLIKVVPFRVTQGLENILDGLDLLRQNKISGQKLVYSVEALR